MLLSRDPGWIDSDQLRAVGRPGWRGILTALSYSGTFVTFLIFRLAPVAEAGSPERIYIASAVAVSGLALLSIFNYNGTGTSGDFYAGSFLGTSSSDRLTGWRQTAFGAVVLTATLTSRPRDFPRPRRRPWLDCVFHRRVRVGCESYSSDDTGFRTPPVGTLLTRSGSMFIRC